MANEFLYQRGARRSAAPQYAPWTAPQSAADISAQALARILRQPQQAMQTQQQQKMQRQSTEAQGDPGAAQMTSGPGPAQLTQLLQSLTADGGLNVEGQGDTQSMGNIGFNENAGPLNPSIGRLLRTLTVMGISGLNPLAGAVASGIINNPDSATGVTSNLATSGLKRAIPGLGIIDMMRQMFGADPVSKVVDQQLQSLVAPAQSPTAVAPAGELGATGGAAGSNGQYGDLPNNQNFFGDQFGQYDPNQGANFMGAITNNSFANIGMDSVDGDGDEGQTGQTGSGGSAGGQGGPRGGTSFGGGEY